MYYKIKNVRDMRTEDELSYPDYLPQKDPFIFYSDCEESDDGQEYDFDYYKPNQKSVKSNSCNSKMETSESSQQEQSTIDSDETNHIEQTDLSDSKSNFFEESSNCRNKKLTKEKKRQEKKLLRISSQLPRSLKKTISQQQTTQQEATVTSEYFL
ncbi:MAG: hypothetical protein EZS28_046066, partial [Streblomastix strix]